MSKLFKDGNRYLSTEGILEVFVIQKAVFYETKEGKLKYEEWRKKSHRGECWKTIGEYIPSWRVVVSYLSIQKINEYSECKPYAIELSTMFPSLEEANKAANELAKFIGCGSITFLDSNENDYIEQYRKD